jgi:hypothetical protein
VNFYSDVLLKNGKQTTASMLGISLFEAVVVMNSETENPPLMGYC